jgi:hypothetical protein
VRILLRDVTAGAPLGVMSLADALHLSRVGPLTCSPHSELVICDSVQAAADQKKQELLEALAVLAPAIQLHSINAANRQSAEIVQTLRNDAAIAESQRGEILAQQTGGFTAIAAQGRAGLMEITDQNQKVLTDVRKGFDETRKQIAEESQRTMAQLVATREDIKVGFVKNGELHEFTHVKLGDLSKENQENFAKMMTMLASLGDRFGGQAHAEDVRPVPTG